ncbi:MAG TPA: ATP-binding cassette domain-containing protein [Mycobacterium sp.]|nr:ATP-binding cassette domain-containing protein [Mycobacterium sp.]HMZ13368.1 ATP-binding cassette domain-containing protein [Mycobacterium sp.]HRD10850.1 ATP-binding cassette domain-containing protein [Mycobacterium sp.]
MSGLRLQARLAERGAEFDLELSSGDVLAVLGPNGAGKSTLLSLIAGLLRPDHARIVLGDRVLTDTAAGVFVPTHQRGVAMLAQQAMLFPHLSVAANVAYGPRCKGQSRTGARAVAAHWLRAVDAEGLASRRPRELSGGQAQRIAIARALATEPDILLLDEPMAALDVAVAPSVRRLLRDILHTDHRTAVIVTHDLLDALAIANRVIVVEQGRIVEAGPVRDVLTSPRSVFAARMAGVNLIPGVVVEPGVIRTPWGSAVFGTGGPESGTGAVALFTPAAVSVDTQPPHGSPRNIFRTTIAELEIHGTAVRVHGADQPDGSSGLFADITPAAAADLDLVPGREIYFAVKTMEVQIHPA